ncbi:MAG: helix-turn-helix domain-containing protein [bacterium]|nr:helix-turn-helix domain-containing protein [bacterium]
MLDLPGVVLLDAVEADGCVPCDVWTARVVPNMTDLATAAALARVTCRERLDAAAIRFLRAQLGLGIAELAEAIGTRPEYLARWEAAMIPMSESAERLLRVLVARRVQAMHPHIPVRAITPFAAATVPLDPPPPRTASIALRLDATARRWIHDAADRLAPARRTLGSLRST